MGYDVFIGLEQEIFFDNHIPTPLEEIYLELVKERGFLIYTPKVQDRKIVLEVTMHNPEKQTMVTFQKSINKEEMTLEGLTIALKHPEEERLLIDSRIEVVYSNGKLNAYSTKNDARIPWQPPQTLETILIILYPIIYPKQQGNLKRKK